MHGFTAAPKATRFFPARSIPNGWPWQVNVGI